jgi:hypothetical protein
MILAESAIDSRDKELHVIVVDDDDTNTPELAHNVDLFAYQGPLKRIRLGWRFASGLLQLILLDLVDCGRLPLRALAALLGGIARSGHIQQAGGHATLSGSSCPIAASPAQIRSCPGVWTYRGGAVLSLKERLTMVRRPHWTMY